MHEGFPPCRDRVVGRRWDSDRPRGEADDRVRRSPHPVVLSNEAGPGDPASTPRAGEGCGAGLAGSRPFRAPMNSFDESLACEQVCKPSRAAGVACLRDRVGSMWLPRPFGHGALEIILRKEVIQPQVPLRLPCYDLVPITGFIFGACLAAPATSDAPRFGGLTGGVYKAQEHIHRGMLTRDY